MPGEAELKENPRSRSAQLRVMEKMLMREMASVNKQN